MRTYSCRAAALAVSALVAVAPAGVRAVDPEHLSWCPPVSLGEAPLNTAAWEFGPELSKDRRTLVFGSNRNAPQRANLYVSRRATPRDPWGAPESLDDINTAAVENAPALAHGGNVLYFASDRPGGVVGESGIGPSCGATPGPAAGTSCDVWFSFRVHEPGQLRWSAPENLGAPVNTEHVEGVGDTFEDESTGTTHFVFSSTRRRGTDGWSADHDLYVSRIGADGRFGEPELIAELSSDADEQRASVTEDGLVLFFQSDRAGAFAGSSDLWVSTRESTEAPWSAPENLGPAINTGAFEGGPRISPDGRTLLFFSGGHGGAGGLDLFVSERAGPDGTCD